MGPNTELMRRYTKYELEDENLYNLFFRGVWYPNYDTYVSYLKRVEKENREFYELMEKKFLLWPNDKVVELSANQEYSLSRFLNHHSFQVIESKYGTVSVGTVPPEVHLSRSSHLICNGFYQDCDTFLDQILSVDGSFTIGICAKKDSLFLQETRKQYLAYAREKRLSCQYYKKHENRNDIYLWHHRGGQNS